MTDVKRRALVRFLYIRRSSPADLRANRCNRVPALVAHLVPIDPCRPWPRNSSSSPRGLPEFDRHAGSRRLYSWLRILATEYHVALHVLQTRIKGDSKRYAEALRALGVEIFPAGDTSLAGLARSIDHGVLFTTFESRAPPCMPIIPPWRERKRGSRAGGSLACTSARTWSSR